MFRCGLRCAAGYDALLSLEFFRRILLGEFPQVHCKRAYINGEENKGYDCSDAVIDGPLLVEYIHTDIWPRVVDVQYVDGNQYEPDFRRTEACVCELEFILQVYILQL